MYLSRQKMSFSYRFIGEIFMGRLRIALATSCDRCQFVILRTFKPSKSIDRSNKNLRKMFQILMKRLTVYLRVRKSCIRKF